MTDLQYLRKWARTASVRSYPFDNVESLGRRIAALGAANTRGRQMGFMSLVRTWARARTVTARPSDNVSALLRRIGAAGLA